MTTLGLDTPFARNLGFQILAGIGIGLNLQVRHSIFVLANLLTPIIAVQAVSELRDIPIATALTLFYQQLGGALILAVAQAVLLDKLLPAMQKINPTITKTDIIDAGATGLKNLVSGPQLAATLVAYAKSLDSIFIISLVMGFLAVISALGVEWKNIKGKKIESTVA